MIFTQIFIVISVSLLVTTAQDIADTPSAPSSVIDNDLQSALHMSYNVESEPTGPGEAGDNAVDKLNNNENSEYPATDEIDRERRTGEIESENNEEEPITEADILAELDDLLMEKRSADDEDDEDDDDDEEDLSRRKRDADLEDDDVYDDDDDDEDDDDTVEDDEEEDDDDDDDDEVSRKKRDIDEDDGEEDDDEEDDDEDEYEINDPNEVKREIDDDDDDDDEDYDDEDDDIDYDDDEDISKRDVAPTESKSTQPVNSQHVGQQSQHVPPPVPIVTPKPNNPVPPPITPAPQARPARDLQDETAEESAKLEGEATNLGEDKTADDNGTDLTKKSLNIMEKYKVPNYIAKHMKPFERAVLPVALWKKSSGQMLLPLDKMLLAKYEKFKKSDSYNQMAASPGFGPIAEKFKLQMKFGRAFTKNPKVDVLWREPHMLSNCWVQSMLSSRYGFSPNCNQDGTFGPKQCFLQRCWCVNKDGSPQERDTGGRFHYKISGAILKCTQHYK